MSAIKEKKLKGVWKKVRVGDSLDLINGRAFKPTEWAKSGLPIVRIQNLNKPQAPFNYYQGELPEKFLLNDGDLLFAWSGTPGTSFGAHIWRGGKAWLNQHIFKVCFDNDEFDKRFLQLAINQNLAEYIRVAHGAAGLAHITKGMFENSELPQPTLDLQRVIVSEIDEQFTRLDAGVAALKRVKANLKRYRASVLKSACDGKLVATEAELAKKEKRKYEPATELIARTPTPPRPNRWNSRSKDVIPGHSALAVGNPQTKLPTGWVWSALVEVAKMESGHTPSRNHPEWWGGNVSWIGIADAREHDGRTIYETFQHTNPAGIANSASRILPKGTVCISRTASVGYVVIMGREMATSQDFVNWIPTSAVTSDWLRIIFCADREALRRFGKGSVHKTIYFPEWLSVHVALPPLAEQKRIAIEVERQLSIIDALETVTDVNLQRASRLRQSILQQAFSGKLVAQKSTEANKDGELSQKRILGQPNRHFARSLLSAEIVHQLYAESTFGRTKHQKIFHLCEHIAQIEEIEGAYHREAAGPLDNKLIYANEKELKKQKWYEELSRDSYGHRYRPLAKAGGHQKYLEKYWTRKLPIIQKLIKLMRSWTTDQCEIFSTTYAAWNDLILWGKEPTEDAILHEVYDRWHIRKQRFSQDKWRKAIAWIKKEGFVPTGFGKPTCQSSV